MADLTLNVAGTPVAVTLGGVPGPVGPPGTLAANSGATLGGPSLVKGNSATIFQVLKADNTAVLKIDSLDGHAVLGVSTEGAPRVFLGTLTSSGDDAALLIGRNLVGTDMRNHAIRDESFHTGTQVGATSAYASLDMAATLNGVGNQDHLRGAQFRGTFAGPGTMQELTAFISQPVISSGIVVSTYGLRVQAPAISGGGAVSGNKFGVNVEVFTGAGFAFFAGGNDSALLGNLQIAGSLTGISTIAASGQATIGAVVITGALSSYAAGDGIALSKNAGVAAYGGIQSFNGVGGTPRGLVLNPAGGQVMVGNGPAFGTTFETMGSIGATTWLRSGSYTVGTVPSAATAGAGAIIYVSNEAGGATAAFSDATNWRRVSDLAVIS